MDGREEGVVGREGMRGGRRDAWIDGGREDGRAGGMERWW